MTSAAFDLDVVNRSLEAFPEEGYAVVPDVLTSDEAGRLYESLGPIISGSRVTGSRRTANERALLREPGFLEAVTSPALLDPLRAILGEDLQLLCYDALEFSPGGGNERDWHTDTSFFADCLLTANAGIYLTDMTPEMGPLYILPGSQRRRRRPSREEAGIPLEGEVRVSVPAGTAVIFDAQAWHSGTRNESAIARRGLFAYFGRYWMKRMDEFYETELPASVLESDEPVVRQLFGLECVAASPMHGELYSGANPHYC
jgi:ectoine hydroxylase-related dioxygenase (phytanoyl-CoA dioxygenase family)